MGACESSKEKKKIISKNNPIIEINNKEIKNNTSLDDEDNLNHLDTHPSSNSQDNEIKKPGLAKYDLNKKSEISFAAHSKVMSVFSSQTEEEVIIRNEVNKKIINKEGDFNNMDFKNLIKKNGGIVLKDNDNMTNVLSYQGINPAFDIGKINKASEIKSMRTLPARTKEKNLLDNNNNDILRLSSKINVSFHDKDPKNDAFINIPKIDEPLPDLDELSTESPILIIRNSLSSQ